jgi:predicted branched-subunit amino acid permease
MRWRLLFAYLLTDEGYAVGIARYNDPDKSPHRHWFVFGAFAALWVCWQITTAIGVVAGQQVPDSWSLDFALALTFIALVIPALRDQPTVAAAIVAATVAVIGFHWPYRTGLFTAAFAGIACGVALDLLQRRIPEPAAVRPPPAAPPERRS